MKKDRESAEAIIVMAVFKPERREMITKRNGEGLGLTLKNQHQKIRKTEKKESSVSIPPHRIVISDERGIARDQTTGPYLQGDSLRLYCDVYGGK
ncbi:hypothetical protein M0802_002902 [Mischocyttarus mexicanus]|nr:hypothetical protein M0802_002902 [Mischocyttarus mexicanus]